MFVASTALECLSPAAWDHVHKLRQNKLNVPTVLFICITLHTAYYTKKAILNNYYTIILISLRV